MTRTISNRASPDNYDFTGLATVYDVECADGRTIVPGAFKHQDASIVPLVWQHKHDSIGNVIGEAYLVHNDNPLGVRAYATFDEGEDGQKAKRLVHRGIMKYLSIYANKLQQERTFVKHGVIRELSLVYSGANPGSSIDHVVIHAATPFEDPVYAEDAAIISSGIELEIYVEPEVIEHSDEPENLKDTEEPIEHSEGETLKDILKTFNPNQKALLTASIAHALTGSPVQLDVDTEDSPEDIYKSLNDKQKVVFDELVVDAANDGASENTVEHDDQDQGEIMTHNVFESAGEDTLVLSREDQQAIISNMKSGTGSFRDALTAYAKDVLEHSITDIDLLYPDFKSVTGDKPFWYTEPQEWVKAVVDAAKKIPFARIKSMYADITTEEARALGYITGEQKIEQVFQVFKRETQPQTIYKLQKLDRDMVVDITDFDAVAWIWQEMELKLKEELARAFLLSDGRAVGHANKIEEEKIRPIYTDDDLYVVRPTTPLAAGASMLDAIDHVTVAMTDYRGQGSPTLFASHKWIVQMLTARDTTNRRIYNTKEQLAGAMDVGRIVYVPFMDNVSRVDGADTLNLRAIIVNMNDYNVGMDRGGQVTKFENFDLNYNKQEYLIETRLSAALVKPKTAVVIEQLAA